MKEQAISFDGTSDRMLHTLYLQTEQDIKAGRVRLHAIEQEWLKRMADEGATIIPGICESEVKNSYDQTAFIPLKEIFHGLDLAKAWVPAHKETVTVPDKWKTNTVLSLAKKYGTQALAIVDKAKLPQPPAIKLIRGEKE